MGNFTLTAAKDGRTGTAAGRVTADNETVALNVQLAINSLIGTVFQRDGTTPAGGVAVYLVPARVPLALSMSPSAAGVLATSTNALGQFGFTIPALDSYTLQAESGAERGRTPVVITTIDPANPVQVNVTFLAKGTVTGVVKDSGGAVQPGAVVKVASRGAFNNTWDAVTDGSGRYTVAGVFVGDISSSAQNTVTRLAGSSNGRLLAEGQTLTLDVTLAATGRVTGQVLARDGSVVATPVRVTIGSTYAAVGSIDLPNGSSYQFDLVPVGRFHGHGDGDRHRRQGHRELAHRRRRRGEDAQRAAGRARDDQRPHRRRGGNPGRGRQGDGQDHDPLQHAGHARFRRERRSAPSPGSPRATSR